MYHLGKVTWAKVHREFESPSLRKNNSMKKILLAVLIIIVLIFISFISFLYYKQINGDTSLGLERVFLSKREAKEPIKKPVIILAFGDMMLDRGVRAAINKNGAEYPFAQIKNFLQGNDIVVVNAEGPFTDNKSVTLGRKNAPLTFTFDPAILPTLKNLGFTLLGQANNHTLNFGVAGFNHSTTSISEAGLSWFGDPRNTNVKPYIQEIQRGNGENIGKNYSERIAFIGYNEFAYKGLENVLQAIKDVRNKATFIVVYPHWGTEYNLKFTTAQQKVGHAFIDAGADVVIGMHPHVIEPIENYNGKLIFYSLGNFIFDQASSTPTGKGIAVKISLEHSTTTYNIFPFSIIKQQANLLEGDERQKILDSINMGTGEIVLPREKATSTSIQTL